MGSSKRLSHSFTARLLVLVLVLVLVLTQLETRWRLMISS